MTRIKGASFDITENMNFEPDSICAIMIPNSEPFSFIVAYFGCLFSRVKPIPIELPITNSRNGLTARFGTLLRRGFSEFRFTCISKCCRLQAIRNVMKKCYEKTKSFLV